MAVKVRQHYIESVVGYLATSANIENGRTIEEIAEATQISRATLYRLVKEIGLNYGIYRAKSPKWPTAYYVVPGVAAAVTGIVPKSFNSIQNITKKQALDSFTRVLDHISDTNLAKIQETFDDKETKLVELLSQFALQAEEPKPNILAPLAVVLIQYVSREI